MLGEHGLAVARGLAREVLEIRQDLLVKGRVQLPGVQQILSNPWNGCRKWRCLFEVILMPFKRFRCMHIKKR